MFRAKKRRIKADHFRTVHYLACLKNYTIGKWEWEWIWMLSLPSFGFSTVSYRKSVFSFVLSPSPLNCCFQHFFTPSWDDFCFLGMGNLWNFYKFQEMVNVFDWWLVWTWTYSHTAQIFCRRLPFHLQKLNGWENRGGHISHTIFP